MKNRTSFWVSAILAACASGSLEAQSERPPDEVAIKVSIGAGPLDQSLQRYAEAAGLQLVYAPELVSGLTSAELSGTFSPRAGLERLLSGTGLTYRFVGARTATLEKVPSGGTRVLGPVRVEGAQQAAPRIGEGVATLGGVRGQQEAETRGLRPVVTTVGAGRPIPIEDNPRSVSVLTADQMEAQDVNDIGEALNRLPGVTVSDEIYSRGQAIERFQVDGGSALDFSGLAIGATGPEFGDRLNLAAYERVELLRGGNAAFVGHGSLGGTLNLVRKRPGSLPAETVSLTAGSWNRMEGLYDVTVPNIGGSNIAFRGVLNLQTTEAFYDKFERDNGLLYGILDVPLSETSRGEFGLRYSNTQTNSPYHPVYRYADGPLLDVPRSTNFGAKWGFADIEETELFTRIKTDFSERWTVNAGLSWTLGDANQLYANSERNNTILSNGERTAYTTTIYGADTSMYANETKILTGDVRVAGQFSTGVVEHNILAQAAYFDIQDTASYARWRNFTRIVNSIEDLYLDDITPDSYPGYRNGRSDRRVQSGIEDLMTWNDKVDLRLGLSHYKSNSFQFTPAYLWERYSNGVDYLFPTSTQNNRDGSTWTPSYSVVLKPWNGLSIAPSYAEGTVNQSLYALNGRQLGPMRYENQELMMRYATSRWVASASYYTADNTNVAQTVPGVLTCAPDGRSQCYFEAGGSQQSRGYDLELSGELVDGLAVTASYNYNKTVYDPGILAQEGITEERPVSSQSPARTAKLFLAWTPSFMPKLQLSAGYSHRSDIYGSGRYFIYDDNGVRTGVLNYKYVSEGYDLFDLGIGYSVTPGLNISMLAENLTDESYLSTTGESYGFYGRPRNVSLNVRWQDPSIARWGGGPTEPNRYPLGNPGRWYTALDLGHHTGSTLEARSPKTSADGSPVEWDFKLGSNFVTTWRVGRHLSSRWRAELEAGFRPIDIRGTVTEGPEPRGLCSIVTGAPAYPDCRAETGKFDTFTALFNGIYSPSSEQARFAPFVGMGLGLAVSQVEIGGRLTNREYPNAAITAGIDDTVIRPAGQAIAGLTLKLAPRLNADLTYRLFYVPNVKWDVTSDSNISAERRTVPYGLEHFRGDLLDQSLSLAFRWNFDLGAH